MLTIVHKIGVSNKTLELKRNLHKDVINIVCSGDPEYHCHGEFYILSRINKISLLLLLQTVQNGSSNRFHHNF